MEKIRKFGLATKMQVLLLIYLVMFCLISFASFRISDQTFLSHTYPVEPIQNWGGLVGAHFVVSCLYLFGSGFFIPILTLFLFITRMLLRQVMIPHLLFAVNLVFFAMSLLFCAERFGWSLSLDGMKVEGGGVIGYLVLSYSQHVLGPVGSLILFLSMAVISLESILEFDIWKVILKGSKKIVTKATKKPSKNPVPQTFHFVQSPAPEPAPSLVLPQQIERKLKSLAEIFGEDRNQQPFDEEYHNSISSKIVEVLQQFGVVGTIGGVDVGPVVSIYHFVPEAGTKQTKVQNLVDDLALALQVESILIQPVPEKKSLGIQIPNRDRQDVLLGGLLKEKIYHKLSDPLAIVLGRSVSGDPMVASLAKMPHLLVAGATGSGKSVCINTILVSLIHKYPPDKIRFILVDPKLLELSVYEGIPHLLMPVITDPKRASVALQWAIKEMDERYEKMKHNKVRNIESYNGMNPTDALPYIVVVIDELADLMLTAAKEVETSIQRLSQKARACGIHMVLATQRPSVDVVTGVIKANLPCRIAFQVTSKHDSRTILDQIGAEKLLGKGDLLYMSPTAIKPARVQGAFVSDQEVCAFVDSIKMKYEDTVFDSKAIAWIEENKSKKEDKQDDVFDPMFDSACEIARQEGKISASFVQRRLKIGYNRAARIVELMTERGLVSDADGAKPRNWIG